MSSTIEAFCLNSNPHTYLMEHTRIMMPRMTIDTLIQLSTYCAHEWLIFSLIFRSLSLQSGSQYPQAISPCLNFHPLPDTGSTKNIAQLCCKNPNHTQLSVQLSTSLMAIPGHIICLRHMSMHLSHRAWSNAPQPKVHLLQLIILTALSKVAIAILHMQVRVQHNVCLSENAGSEPFG